MLGYIGQLYPKLSGTAFSIVLVIGLIGNTLINYLFGVISNAYGINQLPWLILAGVFCLAIFLMLVRPKIVSKIKI
jgi:MFS transporter, FHS family, glucose/mannose:H+ symporter